MALDAISTLSAPTPIAIARRSAATMAPSGKIDLTQSSSGQSERGRRWRIDAASTGHLATPAGAIDAARIVAAPISTGNATPTPQGY
jgi:hypothetical protein